MKKTTLIFLIISFFTTLNSFAVVYVLTCPLLHGTYLSGDLIPDKNYPLFIWYLEMRGVDLMTVRNLQWQTHQAQPQQAFNPLLLCTARTPTGIDVITTMISPFVNCIASSNPHFSFNCSDD